MRTPSYNSIVNFGQDSRSRTLFWTAHIRQSSIHESTKAHWDPVWNPHVFGSWKYGRNWSKRETLLLLLCSEDWWSLWEEHRHEDQEYEIVGGETCCQEEGQRDRHRDREREISKKAKSWGWIAEIAKETIRVLISLPQTAQISHSNSHADMIGSGPGTQIRCAKENEL